MSLQASNLQPTGPPLSPPGTAATSTWVLAEEEEFIEERISVTNVPASTILTPGTPVATRPLSITELGQQVIAWGKKNKGKTWLETFQIDPGYFHWSLARYSSLPPNQQEFVRFCQMRLDFEASRNGP